MLALLLSALLCSAGPAAAATLLLYCSAALLLCYALLALPTLLALLAPLALLPRSDYFGLACLYVSFRSRWRCRVRKGSSA